MSAPAEPRRKRSLFTLLGDIPSLITNLIRGEIDSLKNEIIGKLKQAAVGIGLLIGAALFLFFAVLVLLAAAVFGLGTALPLWLSALIIGGGILVLAVIIALIGVASLKRGVPPAPTETIKSVKKDVRAIKGIGKRENS